MQEALAQQERATAAAEAEKHAAEHDAQRERGRASELHVRCLSAEERCSSLFEEDMQLKAQLAQHAARLQALEQEGVTQSDRTHVLSALLDLLSGCGLGHCVCRAEPLSASV